MEIKKIKHDDGMSDSKSAYNEYDEFGRCERSCRHALKTKMKETTDKVYHEDIAAMLTQKSLGPFACAPDFYPNQLKRPIDTIEEQFREAINQVIIKLTTVCQDKNVMSVEKCAELEATLLTSLRQEAPKLQTRELTRQSITSKLDLLQLWSDRLVASRMIGNRSGDLDGFEKSNPLTFSGTLSTGQNNSPVDAAHELALITKRLNNKVLEGFEKGLLTQLDKYAEQLMELYMEAFDRLYNSCRCCPENLCTRPKPPLVPNPPLPNQPLSQPTSSASSIKPLLVNLLDQMMIRTGKTDPNAAECIADFQLIDNIIEKIDKSLNENLRNNIDSLKFNMIKDIVYQRADNRNSNLTISALISQIDQSLIRNLHSKVVNVMKKHYVAPLVTPLAILVPGMAHVPNRNQEPVNDANVRAANEVEDELTDSTIVEIRYEINTVVFKSPHAKTLTNTEFEHAQKVISNVDYSAIKKMMLRLDFDSSAEHNAGAFVKIIRQITYRIAHNLNHLRCIHADIDFEKVKDLFMLINYGEVRKLLQTYVLLIQERRALPPELVHSSAAPTIVESLATMNTQLASIMDSVVGGGATKDAVKQYCEQNIELLKYVKTLTGLPVDEHTHFDPNAPSTSAAARASMGAGPRGAKRPRFERTFKDIPVILLSDDDEEGEGEWDNYPVRDAATVAAAAVAAIARPGTSGSNAAVTATTRAVLTRAWQEPRYLANEVQLAMNTIASMIWTNTLAFNQSLETMNLALGPSFNVAIEGGIARASAIISASSPPTSSTSSSTSTSTPSSSAAATDKNPQTEK